MNHLLGEIMKYITALLISVTLTFSVNACEPVNQALLSTDLNTQRSQLEDANFECDNLSNYLQLAKIYNQLGEAENAADTLDEAVYLELVKTSDTKIHWLTTKSEIAVANQDTCEASQRIAELSTYESAKNTHQNLRKKLYQSIQGKTLDSKTIACSLTATRSILTRGIKIKPKLDVSILFDFNSDTLTSQGRTQVQAIITAMQSGSMKNKKLNFVGHTDKIGDSSYNINLSQRRAQAVANYIIQFDSSLSHRISTTGKGETQLISYGDSEEDHRLNRRVELEAINTHKPSGITR
ncbi:MAG: OmpA family protein [Marinicella sp.]